MEHSDTPPLAAPELPLPPPENQTRKETPNTEHRTPINKSPLRTLLVVVAGFLSLFLVLRTIAVEPFGVPTGSMAPALVGHHRDGLCPRCGYTVRVGHPTRGSSADHFENVTCTNCDFRMSLTEARDLSGDRLLVDKNVYSLRSPRRWEMAVFRCPNPAPSEFGKPYVKRIVGLPGETITIVGGDVHVNGEVARKGLAEVRETALPVFDMNFAPGPGGWNVRWLVESGDPRLPAHGTPNVTGSPTIEGNALILDAADSPQSTTAVRYRHWHLDDRKENAVRAWNDYDGTPRRRDDYPAAHDFYLKCEVEVTAAATGGEATFDCRLTDGADTVTAEVSVGPRVSGRAHLMRENHGSLGAASGVALEPGRTYRLEFAFVDRRAVLALNGRVVVPPADLPSAAKRAEVSRPLRFGARGCRVVIRNLKLYRDIHYTNYGEHGTQQPALLGPDEYFALGDNSGNSEDSRKWPTPGVPEAAFIGKPFLIHQPLRQSRVSVGGRDRVFQTLDWSRLRWLH